jgi:hypothetical protein
MPVKDLFDARQSRKSPGATAERESQYGDYRERRGSHQTSCTKPNVRREVLQPVDASFLATFVLSTFDPTERAHCLRPRIISGHAPCPQLIDMLHDVKPDLVVEICFDRATSED